MVTPRKPRSQPYRISWPSNIKLSPELQKALGQQFENIDECLQLVFSLLREDADAANRNAIASAVHDRVVMMLGGDGEDGEPGVGIRGADGAPGPAGLMMILDGNDGEDGMPGPPGAGSSSASSLTIAKVAARVALGI